MQGTQQKIPKNQEEKIDYHKKYKIEEVGKHWKCKKYGFEAGKYTDYNRDSTCYLNGSEFVRIYKDKKSQKLLVERFHVYPDNNGNIIMTEKQTLDLGYSDQLRFYNEVFVGMNDVGSLSLTKFINNITERKEDDNRFYFTFDFETKKWKGVWGQPKKSWKLDVGYDGQLFVTSQWKGCKRRKSNQTKLPQSEKQSTQQTKSNNKTQAK